MNHENPAGTESSSDAARQIAVRRFIEVMQQLGSEAWDVVFVAQLLHHFDEPTNRDLAR